MSDMNLSTYTAAHQLFILALVAEYEAIQRELDDYEYQAVMEYRAYAREVESDQPYPDDIAEEISSNLAEWASGLEARQQHIMTYVQTIYNVDLFQHVRSEWSSRYEAWYRRLLDTASDLAKVGA